MLSCPRKLRVLGSCARQRVASRGDRRREIGKCKGVVRADRPARERREDGERCRPIGGEVGSILTAAEELRLDCRRLARECRALADACLGHAELRLQIGDHRRDFPRARLGEGGREERVVDLAPQ